MHQKQIPKSVYMNPEQQEISSSSTIKLQIPPQHQQSYCQFEWHTHQLKSQNESLTNPYLHIFSRYKGKKIGKAQQYKCTPLDYGCKIIGRVTVEGSGGTGFVREWIYGPVGIGRELLGWNDQAKTYNVKVILNKNTPTSSKITLQYQPQQSSAYSISIQIQQTTTFNMKIPSCSPQSSNANHNSNNNPFFKFYDKQDNCLGISMYHQYSQFLDKLKQLKIYSHYGFYLKLQFLARRDRDIFLFQLMRLLGIQVAELGHVDLKRYLVKSVRPSASVISDILNDDKKNVHQHKVKQKQVDQQIYKLLYQAQQFGVQQQFSFDAADTQFLFSNLKRSNINTKNSMIQEGFKQTMYSKNIMNSRISEQKKSLFLDNKKSQQIQNKKNLNSQIQFKTNRPSLKFQRQVNLNISEYSKHQQYNGNNKQNELRTTIGKLRHQIQSLTRTNRKLMQQNKKLKDQNMRLRFRQIKNSTKFIFVDSSKNLNFKQKNPNSPSQNNPNSPKSQNYSIPKKLYFVNKSKQKSKSSKWLSNKKILNQNANQNYNQKQIQNRNQKHQNVMNSSIPSLSEKKIVGLNISQIQNSKLQFQGCEDSFRVSARHFQYKTQISDKKSINKFIPRKKQSNLFINQKNNKQTQQKNQSSVKNHSPPPQTPFFDINLQNTANFGTATSSSNFFSKYITH